MILLSDIVCFEDMSNMYVFWLFQCFTKNFNMFSLQGTQRGPPLAYLLLDTPTQYFSLEIKCNPPPSGNKSFFLTQPTDNANDESEVCAY